MDGLKMTMNDEELKIIRDTAERIVSLYAETLNKDKIGKERRIFQSLKGYLTIKGAAKFLGVTTNTLRNWEKEGKITSYRHSFNNYRLYKPEDLQKILDCIK